MNSRITFLGTAGDSFVAGKQIRASGGMILRAGDNQIHIDPGPGALVRAAECGINLRETSVILISNNNIINCNDMNAVIDAMTYGGFDNKGVLVAGNLVVNGSEDTFPYLTKKHAGFMERIITLHPGQKVGIEDIEIISMPADSDYYGSMGFKITTNDFILGYCSDTKYSREIAKQYRGCDILVLNVAFPGNEKEGGCLDSEDAIKFIMQVNPQLAVIKNFGIKMLKADPLYEGREIQKKTGVKVLVAKDGMAFTPDSYSAESRQKRLSMFGAASEKNAESGEADIREKSDEKELVGKTRPDGAGEDNGAHEDTDEQNPQDGRSYIQPETPDENRDEPESKEEEQKHLISK